MTSSELEMKPSMENISVQGHRIQRQDVWLASVPIVLSIHIWSILHLFEEVPAWIMRLSVWELLGAIAYTQMFALLESIFILVLILIVGFLLPKPWLAYQIVPATSLLILVVTPWAIAAHTYDKVIRAWGVRDFLPWLLLVVISLALALVVASRSEKVKNILSALVERATILSVVYLFIDAISLIIVVIRHI